MAKPLVWLACSIVLLVGCRQRGGEDGIEIRASHLISPSVNFTVTLKTPAKVSPVAVTLGAAGNVSIGGGAQIKRAGGLFSVTTNMGTAGIQAQPDAVLGDVWSQSQVDLRDRVHVLGTVRAAQVTRGTGVVIDNGIDSTTPLTPATVTTWTVTYPAATVADVLVQPGKTATQPPGRYGAVTISGSATLKLSSGTYFLDTLDLEPTGKITLTQADGPVVIYVRNSIILRGTFNVSPAAPPDLLIGFLGTSEVFVEAPFSGTIVAPSTRVTLRSVTGGHSGAFFGRDILVDASAVVNHRSANVILVVSKPTVDACVAAIVPDPTLTGQAQALQYQLDLARYCTKVDIGTCEATVRARVRLDYFAAAGQMIRGVTTAAPYLALVKDRERKLAQIRANETLACPITTGDSDGDLVPGSKDACPNTPPLTPTFDNGCTDSSVPDTSAVQNVDWTKVRFAIPADPRCLTAPPPKTPAPLGAWRFPPDPTVGKAIWFSASSDTSGCPVFYDVEVELTDGAGPRAMIIQVPQEDANVTWISRPAGILQVNFHVTDPGTRGAWASYGVWTEQYRVRAYHAGGAMSAWSEWFSPGYEPCVAGACGDFP